MPEALISGESVPEVHNHLIQRPHKALKHKSNYKIPSQHQHTSCPGANPQFCCAFIIKRVLFLLPRKAAEAWCKLEARESFMESPHL